MSSIQNITQVAGGSTTIESINLPVVKPGEFAPSATYTTSGVSLTINNSSNTAPFLSLNVPKDQSSPVTGMMNGVPITADAQTGIFSTIWVGPGTAGNWYWFIPLTPTMMSIFMKPNGQNPTFIGNRSFQQLGNVFTFSRGDTLTLIDNETIQLADRGRIDSLKALKLA